MPAPQHLGEIFALAAPICWSVAVILFRITGQSVPPVALNLFKNVLALTLFTGTLIVIGSPIWRDVPASDLALLLLSGVIGIGISDTLLFAGLNRLGAGLQAIVSTSYSPIIIVLSLLFLGESLTLVQSLGALLIVGAVLVVSWVRDPVAQQRVPGRRMGVALGIAAMVTQGISIVMIKPLLEESPLIWATAWRLMGGQLVIVPLAFGLRSQRRTLGVLLRPATWKAMVPASIMGTYVALLFWVGGMKYAPASIAAVLNQTSTLWTFLLAVWILHEPITRRRVMGLVLGLVGVLLVSLS